MEVINSDFSPDVVASGRPLGSMVLRAIIVEDESYVMSF